MLQRTLLSFFCLVLTVVVASVARADDVAQAEALFESARELREKGDYAAACPKFQASFELDKQLGTLINIADCYEKLGKWATAWARYKAALEWAKKDKDDRVGFIQEGRDRVEPKVPKLIVNVQNPVDELTVKMDKTEMKPATFGLPLPVDPGEVTVGVYRGEQQLDSQAATAADGQTTTIDLDLKAIAEANPAVVAPVPDDGKQDEKPDTVTPTEPYDPTLRNVGLIVGGVGLLGVLVAGGLEIGALVKKSQAESEDSCVNKFCSPAGLEAADSAATFAEIGQWVGIGGLVVLAVGATIFLVSPSEPDEPAAAWSLTPMLGIDGGGIGVQGTF